MTTKALGEHQQANERNRADDCDSGRNLGDGHGNAESRYRHVGPLHRTAATATATAAAFDSRSSQRVVGLAIADHRLVVDAARIHCITRPSAPLGDRPWCGASRCPTDDLRG